MTRTLKLFLTLSLFCLSLGTMAQVDKNKKKTEEPEDSLTLNVIVDDTLRYQKLPYDTVTFEAGDVVELKQADEMIGYKDSLTKAIGNVIFVQGDTKVYCDSAYKYFDSNNVDLFGNVRMIQDSLNINCDRAFYNGDMRLLQARSNVNARSPSMSLRTDFLDYSLNSKLGYYFGGGTIVDSKNTLSSQSGSYDTQSRHFFFKDNVKVNGRTKNSTYNITSDTLQYNSYSKVAFFQGPTHIKTPNGKIFAYRGTYNTVNQVSNFSGRSMVENDQYILRGDYLHYQEQRVYGIAKGNAEIFIKEDSVLINGDHGKFLGSKGITRVYGNATTRSINNGDTLFLSADTLVSYNKKVLPNGRKAPPLDSIAKAKQKKAIVAYHKVKIFRKDMQGKCDSLLYDMKDSTIHFFKDPILWHEGNQMTSDSLRVIMKNDEIDHVEMRQNSFVISEDTVKNHNQMKGRTMDVFFKDQEIDLLDVKGNAETIYFILEENTNLLKGLSKTISSNIKGFFENNDIVKMGYYKDVDGKVIPPNLVSDSDKKLAGYHWRPMERPTRQTVLLRNPPKEKSSKKEDKKKVDKIKNPKDKKSIEAVAQKDKEDQHPTDHLKDIELDRKDKKDIELDKKDEKKDTQKDVKEELKDDNGNKEVSDPQTPKNKLTKEEKKVFRAKKKELRIARRRKRRLKRMIKASQKRKKK